MFTFIVNPVSGNGRGIKAWRKMELTLKARHVEYDVLFTGSIGDARKATAHLLKASQTDRSPQTVVAVGGDGTVNEVVNGFFDAYESTDLLNPPVHPFEGQFPYPCKFGHVPCGSGNDYARSHDIPLNIHEALELLLTEPDTYMIDLIRSGNHAAVNSIGCGLDGQVAKTTNEARYKRLLSFLKLGKLTYVLSLIQILFSYVPRDVVLHIDGQTIQLNKVWLICIANAPFYGGGMKICPNALPDDGLAEICAVSGLSRWKLLLVFPLVYSGKHVTHPAVSFYSGRSISIETTESLVTQADGEVLKDSACPISIQMLPARLSVVGQYTRERRPNMNK